MTRTRPAAVAAALLAIATIVPVAAAHGPDPTVGGSLWRPNQAVSFSWRSTPAPPSWIRTAFAGAAADVTATRGSKAATFAYAAGASSVVGYGEPTGCSASGIACFDRSGAPSTFRIWYRAHGYRFDWGTLQWCEGQASPTNGCFNAETVGIDELGHVEVLGHHANYSGDSDYLDATVQTVSHARPAIGWNVEVLGRCDVARLQLEYDRLTTSSPFSTCLSIGTTTSLTANASSVAYGTTVTFSGQLRTIASTAYRSLSNDAIANRVVTLERRVPGSTSWTIFGTMAASGDAYASAISLRATYEWRAVFAPSGEGLIGSSSAVIRVTVGPCSGICPTTLSRR